MLRAFKYSPTKTRNAAAITRNYKLKRKPKVFQSQSAKLGLRQWRQNSMLIASEFKKIQEKSRKTKTALADCRVSTRDRSGLFYSPIDRRNTQYGQRH